MRYSAGQWKRSPAPGTGRQAARFRGGGADLSLAIRKRHAADHAVTRLFGRAVPGIGEQAWLLSGDRTLVVLAGPGTCGWTFTACHDPREPMS